MKITELMTDDAVLKELGRRLARSRIDRGLTQARLAREAGLGKRTVERMENGAAAQLDSLVRVLRALGLLHNLELLLPPGDARPLDYLEREGKPRRRVSTRAGEARKPWAWDDKP